MFQLIAESFLKQIKIVKLKKTNNNLIIKQIIGTLDIKLYKYTQHLYLSATLPGLNLYEKVNHGL